MSNFTPRSGWTDWWKSNLWTGAGRHNYEIVLYGDETAEITYDYIYMGIDRHCYHFYGEHEKISDSHGWIHINKIENVAPGMPTTGAARDIDISAFGDDILLEYYRISKSPFLQHPGDMLNMAEYTGHAGWNSHFEVFVVLHRFVEEILESLHYELENPSDEHEQPNSEAVKEINDLFANIDKLKFERVQA